MMRRRGRGTGASARGDGHSPGLDLDHRLPGANEMSGGLDGDGAAGRVPAWVGVGGWCDPSRLTQASLLLSLVVFEFLTVRET